MSTTARPNKHLHSDLLASDSRSPSIIACGGPRQGRRRKRAAIVDALTGRFDEHHAELADMLLSQIDRLTAQIEQLDTRIEQLLADIPAARAAPGVDTGDGGPTPQYLSAVERLDEITGVGRHAAQVIIAEVGLSMTIFPTCGHLVSWAKLAPRTIQSGTSTRTGRTGKGILVIVWHLLADPTSRYRDLGPNFFDTRLRPERRKNSHIRQLEALGYKVTLEPAA